MEQLDRMPGGHQPAPSFSTVSTTQSATESEGLRTANFALFYINGDGLG